MRRFSRRLSTHPATRVCVSGLALLAGSAHAPLTRADTSAAAGTAGALGGWVRETAPKAGTDSASPKELSRACGVPDAALDRVAAKLIERKRNGLSYLEGDGLTELLRQNGEPHVWPRAWIASGRDLDDASARARLAAFGGSEVEEGERRCGTARYVSASGPDIVAAVALNAVADLDAPLPVIGRTGQWLEMRATLRVPATGARVVVTGPHGAPKAVLTAWDGKRARARFVLSEPGAFVVQLVADTQRGPRPVLEARVFADVIPEASFLASPAPGEEAGRTLGGGEALYAMVNALRAGEHLRHLIRDPRLEAMASAHVARMQAARAVGHDVGGGDPFARAQEAGIPVESVGENVANAESLVAAYRTLYRSPSHRANLVRAEYTHMGFAVHQGKSGVWVAQVFATIP